MCTFPTERRQRSQGTLAQDGLFCPPQTPASRLQLKRPSRLSGGRPLQGFLWPTAATGILAPLPRGGVLCWPSFRASFPAPWLSPAAQEGDTTVEVELVVVADDGAGTPRDDLGCASAAACRMPITWTKSASLKSLAFLRRR